LYAYVCHHLARQLVNQSRFVEAKLLYEIVYNTCVEMADPNAWASDFLEMYPGDCIWLNEQIACQMDTSANLTTGPDSTPLSENAAFVDLRQAFEDLSIAQKCTLSRILVTEESLVPSGEGS